MHAGVLHGTDRLDRARQLAFETALVIDLFGKLADPELLVLHQLETDAATLGKPLRCQAQTRFVDIRTRHEDGIAAFAEPVGNVHLFERRDDRAAVAFGDVRE